MRIAIIGTGISGLVAAHLLAPIHDVVVYEKEPRPGGHTHTITIEVDGATKRVDTGFLVYTEQTYPGLTRLFGELGIATQPSDMSFSVTDERCGLEWRGTDLRSVFAQPRNLARPLFLAMLVDVVRFNRLLASLDDAVGSSDLSLAALVAGHRWSPRFIEWYLVPLGSSIWSSSPEGFMEMPAVMLARFLGRHGLLSFGSKPAWRTVTGGAATYVDAVLEPLRAQGRLRLDAPVTGIRRSPHGVAVTSSGAGGSEVFDHVVIATHSDEALALLDDASPEEKEILGAIRYQTNDITVHTDVSFMPSAPRAWAAWNFHQGIDVPGETGVTMTYHLNALQGLHTPTPVLETLNRHDEVDPERVLAHFAYAHPMLTTSAIAAQARHAEISGPPHALSFCGAYWANGFHEDGLQSGVRVATALGATW